MEFHQAYANPYPHRHYAPYGGHFPIYGGGGGGFGGSEVEEEEVLQPRSWETDYQAIQRKFGEKGYSRVPEIVFWNLRDSSATPVVGTQNGVALVSGFSKNLLTMFMDGGGIVNPEDVMGLAIAGEEYKKLVVFD
ncbi:unnamed protein product [Linum tenue]|nr:unnamed protein product [Linum tenue]